MPGFDIGSSVNALTNWVTTSTLIRNVMQNSIYTTLLLTIIVLIVLSCTTKVENAAKTFFYLFVSMLVVVVIHYNVLTSSIREKATNQNISSIFTGMNSTIPNKDSIVGRGETSDYQIDKISDKTSDNSSGAPVLLKNGSEVFQITDVLI